MEKEMKDSFIDGNMCLIILFTCKKNKTSNGKKNIGFPMEFFMDDLLSL